MMAQMLVVLAVLGGLVALLWLLRRKGLAQVSMPRRKRSGGRQLEILERLPLTATHSLHLVRAGKTVLLVGVSPQSCQALTTVPAAASPDPAWEASLCQE